MNNGVAIGLVTFNRKADLVFGLSKLAESEVKPDKVYIIDNASTDGTFKHLLASGYQFVPAENAYDAKGVSAVFESQLLNGVPVVYAIMKQNKGGAGGFHVAQRLIVDAEHEWLWLMDDDGYPSSDCLSRLLASAEKSNLDMLNPLVIEIGQQETLAFGLPGGVLTRSDALANSVDGLIVSAANPFNGTFIKSSVVNDIGLIKKEMFIWGDEVEYLHRLTAAGYHYATDVSAEFFHPASKTLYDEFLWRFKVPTKPRRLEMNFYRNHGYINKKYFNKFGFFYLIKYTLYFLSKFDFSRLLNFYRYYFDGRKGSFELPCIR